MAIEGKRNKGKLNFFEFVYELGDRVNRKLKKPQKIKDAKVISIGNITVGGTGKTPATIYLANLLQNEFSNIGILSRGYGGSLVKEGGILSDGKKLLLSESESGEEPYLIAANLPEIPVAIGKRRKDSATLLQKQFDCNLFILDDGFQHYALKRDIDIVLIDATNPFGNGYLLPAGTLREKIESIARAQLIIITKCNLVEATKLVEIEAELSKHINAENIFHASHNVAGLVRLPTSYDLEAMKDTVMLKSSTIKNESVIALAGIANHSAFEKTLEKMGAAAIESISFKDHHQYSPRDIKSILQRITKYQFLITTEKDWVKLSKYKNKFEELKNFYMVKIEFSLDNNEVLFKEKIKKLML